MREPHFFQSENPDAECPTCRFPSWSHDPAQVYMALQRHREAAIVDSLDAAWAAAEAALPEGWCLKLHSDVDVDATDYLAIAQPNTEMPRGVGEWCPGPTPAAALRALAERLESRR